jgi:hypothetical protein
VNALINLAMKSTGLGLEGISKTLGVPVSQLRRLRPETRLPYETEQTLRELTKIGDMAPEFVLLTGGVGNAEKWAELLDYYADMAWENSEAGYNSYYFNREDFERPLLHHMTISTLSDAGILLPEHFPSELNFHSNDSCIDEEEWVHRSQLRDGNMYGCLIRDLYSSLNDVYGFYSAYLSELFDDEEMGLMDTPAENIEPSLMSLAMAKIEVDVELHPRFQEFQRRTNSEFEGWLTIVRQRAYKAGYPVKVEILNLLYDSHDSLGHQAEAESFGFNDSRLHPNVYMNELLVGMRVIHQVLPVILNQLGAMEKFKLNESELGLGRPLTSEPNLVREKMDLSKFKTDGIYDVFISHASEDKDAIVKSLATSLANRGLRVWYDEFTLQIGDSLRRMIDRGIASSRIGLVVLSPSFIKKDWTNHELDGILARTLVGQQQILPIWHEISKQEVLDYSPSLADKVARSTANYTADEIATEIASLLRTQAV